MFLKLSGHLFMQTCERESCILKTVMLEYRKNSLETVPYKKQRGIEMNIYSQMCGLILMVVLTVFYVRKKALKLNTHIVYNYLLGVTISCIVLDILSIVVIYYREVLPFPLVAGVCKLYLASLVAEGMEGLLYVCSDVYPRQKEFVRSTKWFSVLALCMIIIIFCLPISIYQEGNVVFTQGPSVIFTYISAVGFVVLNIILLIYKWKEINPRRGRVVAVWLFIWVLAALIQFLDNRLLLVGYATAIGVTIIYLRLENPELNLDQATGLFNQGAFVAYMRHQYIQKQDFSAIAVIFSEGLHANAEENLSDNFTMSVIKKIDSMEKALVFKLSEDEILVCFQNVADATEGLAQIKKIFEEYAKLYGEDIIKPQYLYVPQGMVVGDGRELLHLLHYAERKMEEYHKHGIITVDKEIVAQMRNEEDMVALIQEAMEKDRIEIYYQPIFSTEGKKCVSAEALVRMCDTEGKIVPPGKFIPIVETNGMILQLGKLIFDKVCRFCVEQHIEQYGLEYIEVNLSVAQCGYGNLAKEYISIMEKYRVNPGFINLEITESASLEEKETLLHNMNLLMDYGVRFSLDDFGTGQSNLNYIVDMPVDIVKFDRQMINAYFENKKAKYVMDAAMHMIQGMKLKIVSEGIEEEKQYETMENLGIDYIQGFYFSKPLPEKEFLVFLQKQNNAEMLS